MTNREMMEIAMRQSAEDMGCHGNRSAGDVGSVDW